MERRDFLKISATGIAASAIIPTFANPLTKTEYNITNKPKNAKYIWFAKESTDRNTYAAFRKTFTLKNIPKEAIFNVFADSSYQLFINGEFIEFGPVRFDPKYPMFDRHNIAKHLVSGKNVIAIQAKYFGCRTYKSIKNMGGMVAWGEIVDGKNIIDFTSNTSNWKCIQNKAYSPFAQKISFALDTKDIFDQSLEEKGWKTVNFDDSNWNNAIELTNQNAWGEQEERSIPFMAGTDIPITNLLHALPLQQTEDRYSFTIPIPHFFEPELKNAFANFLAFKTWIYSPKDQIITAGVFWGETWLNGEELPKAGIDKFRSQRLNQTWNLKKGWNYYFGKVGTYYDAHHHYLALPKNRGLIISADKKMDSEYSFFFLPNIKKDVFNAHLKDLSLPWPEGEDLAAVGGWEKALKTTVAHSPEKDMSWDAFGPTIENIKLEELEGHTFTTDKYPEGFTLLLSFDHTQLVFHKLKLSGIKDTIIDIGYSEHLSENGQHLKQNHNYTGNDRIYCSEDKIEWTTSQPRGMWYIAITVRNIKENVTLESLSFRSAMYPVEKRGSFKCSEPILNEIWMMGQRTQALNMEDAYVDCVGRERGMYLRDTLIQYHNNLALFGDQKLFQRCVQLYGQSPDATGKFRAVYPNIGDYTISDFALNMPDGYLAYYENTGDKNRTNADWTALQNNLAWFNDLADEREDLLLDAEWDKHRGIKAHYGGFHGDLQTVEGFHDITGIHGVFSMTYLICLQSMKKLAESHGKKKDLTDINRRINILEKSCMKFWDNEKGVFADNLKKSTYSMHVNLFAIRCGIATEEQIIRIRKYIRTTFPSIFVDGHDPESGTHFSPNFAFYIFDGLYKAGLADMAQKYMCEGWGWALHQGLKTTPEYFRLTSSLAHAWSSNPSYYLSKNVLGIQFPEAPNLNKVEIKVNTMNINWAEGTYPHPNGGEIKVKWHKKDDGTIVADTLEAPEGVEIIIG